MAKKGTSGKQKVSLTEGLADALVTSAFVTMAVLNKLAADNDLSLTLLRVLGILRDRRPRMTELADYLGLGKQTMSGLIVRAEARGLVERTAASNDGRAVDVILTSDGAALVAQLHLQVQQALGPLTDHLSASDKRQLQNLLQLMLDGPRD